MYFLSKFNEVIGIISQNENVYIYGAGNYAIKFYDRLKEAQQDMKIRGYIVSKKGNDVFRMNGKPVYSIDEFSDFGEKSSLIVVAVNKQYADEIAHMLNGYSNLVFLHKYVRDCLNNQEELQLFLGKDAEFYKEYIADWTYYNNKVGYNEFCQQIEYRKKQKVNYKQIVFMVGLKSALPRHIKCASALRRKGYKVRFIILPYVNWEMVKDELNSSGVQVEQCISSSIEEIMYRMLQYKPLIYYFEDNWGDCTWSNIILSQKEIFGKIIVTRYDVLNDGVMRVSEYAKATEKYMLEHADGIIWRWFAKDRMEEKGMHFRGGSLQFLDCCSSLNIIEALDKKKCSRKQSVDKSIKLVCVSNQLCHFLKCNSTDYMHVALITEVMDAIEDIDCSFDLFVWDLNDEEERQREELERKYHKLKIHTGIPHKITLERLKEYDYGVELFSGKKAIDENVEINGTLFSRIVEDSSTNRFFDYLDAGLPIIAIAPRRLIEAINKWNIVIPMDLTTLDINYLKEKKEYYKANVQIARLELSIDNQIDKMIDFMHEVAECYDVSR